jgi:hippurate hydrolase
MPEITVADDYTPPVANDPDLVTEVAASMCRILGSGNVIRVDPSTIAEGFGCYGRTPEQVKIGLFWLGGVNPAKYSESKKKDTMLPALHSSTFSPDFRPAYITGVSAMSRTVIDLLSGN